MKRPYVDTHVHLTDGRYEHPEQIITDFEKDGIDFVITVGYDLPSSRTCVELAERYDEVYAAVGVHPHDADSFSPRDLAELAELARCEKVVAIGEIGLDYHYDRSARETQKRVFAEQLRLADRLELPVILHVREATGDCNQILLENRAYLRRGGLLHCYACGAELVPFYQDLGLSFAFGGSITFRNASKLIQAVRAVPKDRLLTETDCPYLTPEPFRGTTNEPKYVALVAKKLAELRGEEEAGLCQAVRENALRLFPRLRAAKSAFFESAQDKSACVKG